MSDADYTTADGESTEGWSGSDTSHARASRERRTGRDLHRREATWDVVRLGGLNGATWREVAEALHCHHGAASGALSNLHKAGKVARLKQQSGGSAIYVLPHAVNDRPVSEYGRIKPPEGMTLEQYEQALQNARDEAVMDLADDVERAAVKAELEGRVEVARYFAELGSSLLKEMPNPAVAHNKNCWQQHPRCAVGILIRTADRFIKDNSVEGL